MRVVTKQRVSTEGIFEWASVLAMYCLAYFTTLAAAAAARAPGTLGVGAVLLWATMVAWRLWCFGGPSGADVVFVLLLAAFQNVFLGLVVPSLTADEVRLLLTANIVMPVLLLTGVWLTVPSSIAGGRHVVPTAIVVSLGLMIGASVLLFGFMGAATLASTRNLLAPPVFLLLGSMSAHRDVAIGRLFRAVAVVAVIVIVVGLVERFIVPDVWTHLNVGELWEKKGLRNLSASGVPMNWYSSERIDGHVLRRMVSTFAEPVNLGTFLFLAVLAGYHLRKPWLILLGLAGLLLALSKGAALGVMVLLCVWGYYRLPRWASVSVAVSCLVVGVAFLLYSVKFATGSLIAHVLGAAVAIVGLVEFPLGEGVGHVGTLARQFTDVSRLTVQESGIGMLVGQMGIPGLLWFLALALWLFDRIRKLDDPTLRITGIAMLGSIILNIVFNEVALSPNSCALYFFILGQLSYLSNKSSVQDTDGLDVLEATTT